MTDGNSATASKTYNLTIDPALAISGPSTLAAGMVNAAYSAPVTATGGSGTYTWSQTGLPGGLSIGSGNGVITGTPTTATGSPFSVQVTVTDGNSVTANKTYSLTIKAALAISGPSALPVGTVSTLYLATVTATGGVGSYTWSQTGLPTGLSLATGTGVISGVPGTTGGSPFSVQVTVTDGNSTTASKTYNLTVDPAMAIMGPSALPVGTVNAAYPATTVTAAGGNWSYTWSATGLPSGLSIVTGTGAITGTPTTSAGSPFSVQVTATDGNSVTATKSYNLTVDPALVISTPSTLPAGTVNVAYPTTTLTALGGSGTYTWSQTGLPTGLSLGSSSGAISGTPSTNTGSPFSVQVTVTDGNSVSVNKTYSLTVNGALAISTPATLPVGTVNAPYSATVTATGGTGTYTWSQTGLPGGLSLVAGTGAITGTPTTNTGSPFSVQVTVTDGNSATASKTYNLTIDPALAISGPSTLAAGMVNAAYSAPVTATGGSGTFTWSQTGLPGGLSIGSGSGVITGTPLTATGSPFSVQVTVTDGNSVTANKTYILTVTGVLAVSTPANLPAGTANVAYPATTLKTTGGTLPYAWSATGLPPGLNIGASTGTITGTPTTTAGSPFSVQVSVTDGNSTTASRTYTLTINPPPVVSGPASLPAGTVNAPYPASTMIATGGSGNLTWTATGLPGGLSLNTGTGVISGTPSTAAGSPFSVQITVTDSNSATSTRSYTLSVSLGLAVSGPASLPLGVVGMAYPATTATATGGSGAYAWSAVGLPAVLAINTATGAIVGTPTTSTGSPFTVQLTVTDSNLFTASRSYTLTVNPALSISGPASLPAGTVNTGYPHTTVSASGGSGVYTWSAAGLPSGMSIGPTTGTITGAPLTSTGSPFNVQVTVTDSNTSTVNRSYILTINGGLSLAITGPSALPVGVVNVTYPATAISAEGGGGSYVWSATGLPPGLSMDPGTGTITGTPTTIAGSPFTVLVTVEDASSTTTTHSFSLTINGMLTVTGPASLPAGTSGASYPVTAVTETGGDPPYAWTATGLPAGLRLASTTGVITGTPATNNGSPFTVQVTVTDSSGATASRTYTLTINLPATLSVSAPASLPAGTVNMAYPATTPAAAGANGACTWSVTGLPVGLSMDSGTGAITGTPASNAGSPFTVQVTVTDSTGAAASRVYTLTVNAAVSTLPATSGVSNAAGGQPLVAPNSWVSVYGENFVPAGFTDDWSKSIANGKLPTTLDGVSVTVGGQAAYVSYVSEAQVNALLPDVGYGAVQVSVTTPAGTSTSITVSSQQYSPAFFPWPNSQPVATHVDYTLAAKNGTFQGAPTVPAKPGEVIILWCTGFGPTDPVAPVGVPIPVGPTYNTASPVTATIGGMPASVYGAALASGFSGLYQLVVTVPASLQNGDYPVIASINGAESPAAILTVYK